MLAIIVLLVLAIVVASVASWNLFAVTTASQASITAQHFNDELYNVKRMLLAASTIYTEQVEVESDVFEIFKRTALPAGQARGDYNTLPASFLKPRNPYGKAYVYCPFGAVQAPSYGSSIKAGPSSIYDANTATLAKNGRSDTYVMSTQANQFTMRGVQGLVISPYQQSTGSVRCGDVAFDESIQQFTVSGGRVATISSIEIEGANLTQ